MILSKCCKEVIYTVDTLEGAYYQCAKCLKATEATTSLLFFPDETCSNDENMDKE